MNDGGSTNSVMPKVYWPYCSAAVSADRPSVDCSVPSTSDWSSSVIRLMPPPASVMGTPMRSSCPMVRPSGSGTSVPGVRSSRPSAHSRKRSPSAVPQVTPAMAPAAPSSGAAPRCSKKAQSPSPTASLQADSMIWLTAVGVMLPSPWV